MTEAEAILSFALVFGAVGLTRAMFQSKSAMLGFPSAILWAILGGYLYSLSATTWDVYFIFAFACLLGMTTFCALGAYGLREKRDALGETEMERGDGNKIVGDADKPTKTWYEDDGMSELDDNMRPVGGSKTKRTTGSKRRGEFNF